jgi:GTP pyrophosphokinase
VNLLSVNTETDRREHVATMRLRVEVPDLTFLGKLLNRISSLNNVISAVRLSDTGAERAG